MNVLLRIIIPACNEAERIEPTVRDYCAVFADVARIVVVANGCTDATAERIAQMQATYPNLELLLIPGRIGKGGAVRAGFAAGEEPFVGFVDADGSTPALEFARLFQICREGGTDAVIGSRWLPGSQVAPAQPRLRRFASRTFNFIVRMLFGLHFADTQCGAKIFTRAAVRDVLGSLEAADFAFDIEVLWRLSRHGFRIREVPTVWSDRCQGTKIQLASSSRAMLATVIRMRLRDSVLWRLPFLEYFGRRGVIPVTRGTTALVIGYDPRGAADGAPVAMLLKELRSVGLRLDFASDIAPDRWRFFCWYATTSKRQYDALLEVESSRPSYIPPVSAKRTFLLRDTGARRSRWIYRMLYRRSQSIAVGGDNAALVAEKIVAEIGSGLYRAHFNTDGLMHVLNFRDHISGERSQHVLR